MQEEEEDWPEASPSPRPHHPDISKESGFNSSSETIINTSSEENHDPLQPNGVSDVIDSVSSIAIDDVHFSNKSSDFGFHGTLFDVFQAFKFDSKFPLEFQSLSSLLKEIMSVNYLPDGRNHPLTLCLWHVSSSSGNSAPLEIVRIFSKYGVDMTSVTAFAGNLLFDLILMIKMSQWQTTIKELMLTLVRYNTNADFGWKNEDGQTVHDFGFIHCLQHENLLPLLLPMPDCERQPYPSGSVSFDIIPVKKADKTNKSIIVTSNLRIKKDPV